MADVNQVNQTGTVSGSTGTTAASGDSGYMTVDEFEQKVGQDMVMRNMDRLTKSMREARKDMIGEEKKDYYA